MNRILELVNVILFFDRLPVECPVEMHRDKLKLGYSYQVACFCSAPALPFAARSLSIRFALPLVTAR